MTKEELISPYTTWVEYPDGDGENVISKEDALRLLEECAKQEAINFAEWVLNGVWGLSSVGSWKNLTTEIPMDYSSEKLYELYQQSKLK